MRRALVIAGRSFVGRNICFELNARGFEVFATVRKSPKLDLTERVCDITDRDCVFRLIRDVAPDHVVQCAGVTDPNQAALAQNVHVDGTSNVLAALREYAPEASFLALGSAAEYGPAPVESLPLDEDYVPQPIGTYGETKLAQTHVVQQAAANCQRAVVLRPFNILGPGLPETYFAAGLASRLRELPPTPQEFEIFNPHATRDFVDVRDVARAVGLLLEQPPEPADSVVFNVCSCTQTTILAVAEFMGQLAGGHRPKPAGHETSRGGISFSQGSFEKLNKHCQWQPEFEWQQSIRDLWAAVTEDP
jgi:GDP-4-dehydro-6-deoxy-D-mannose reductase